MLILLALLAEPLQASAARPVVPIMLEAGDTDPCSDGQVAGLRADGDGFLAVRAEPFAGARELARLRNGRRVHLCSARGDWIGIVYGAPDQDCGVTSALAESRAYAGPCSAGWVHRRWIEVIAG